MVGLFVFYSLIDLSTRLLSRINIVRLDDPSLLIGSVLSNRVAYAVALVGLAVIAWRWPRRLWSPWSWIEHGQVIRRFAMVLIVYLAWQGAFYDMNFLLGRWHVADRLLLVALGAAAWYRPVLIGAFVLQFRVIAGQFTYPFGSTAAQNVNELLVIALIAVAATHLLFVTTGQRKTSPLLMILSAAVATHYFIPGRAKVAVDWMNQTDLSNLPLSGYIAGWLGSTDGSFSRSLSRLIDSIEVPMLWGTLVVELGSLIAALHYKVMRIWLPLAAIFHAGIFLTSGFWFLPWIILEMLLLVIFTRPSLREWVRENATLPRMAITAIAITVAGGFLFHPPRLTWIDDDVSSGYRFEATGESGATYTIPPAHFSPLVQELRFTFLTTDSDTVVSSGEPDPVELIRGADQFLISFFEHANRRAEAGGAPIVSALLPDPFWMSAPAPQYEFSEPLERLDFYLVRAVHLADGFDLRRELIATIETGADGDPEFTSPTS